jgi:hypothetical protein
VAVSFGGAVGPEAGLIAVVANVSSLVGLRMFVVHGSALGPLVVGVAVGVLVLRFLPAPATEHGDAARLPTGD